MQLTERDVQRWVYAAKRQNFAVLVPNYTPRRWFECDVFGVTKAGYFHEFEVKLTKSDFKADAKKRDHRKLVRRQPTEDDPRRATWEDGPLKHQRLAQADRWGPSQFWYVVPQGLVVPQDVPDWAGLVYARPVHAGHFDWGTLDAQRRAPKLHRHTVSKELITHAVGVCMYRYWDALADLMVSRRQVERLEHEARQMREREKEEQVEDTVWIEHQGVITRSDKAVLVDMTGSGSLGREVWIPKSQIVDEDEEENKLEVRRWWADKKELY